LAEDLAFGMATKPVNMLTAKTDLLRVCMMRMTTVLRPES
jgi:hypothetical protein